MLHEQCTILSTCGYNGLLEDHLVEEKEWGVLGFFFNFLFFLWVKEMSSFGVVNCNGEKEDEIFMLLML